MTPLAINDIVTIVIDITLGTTVTGRIVRLTRFTVCIVLDDGTLEISNRLNARKVR